MERRSFFRSMLAAPLALIGMGQGRPAPQLRLLKRAIELDLGKVSTSHNHYADVNPFTGEYMPNDLISSREILEVSGWNTGDGYFSEGDCWASDWVAYANNFDLDDCWNRISPKLKPFLAMSSLPQYFVSSTYLDPTGIFSCQPTIMCVTPVSTTSKNFNPSVMQP